MFCGRGFTGGGKYLKVHLSANDYYEKGKTVSGVWMGRACGKFGVKEGNVVQSDEFAAMAEGMSPDGTKLCNMFAGAKLNAEGGVLSKGRRSFYDFTLNAPKSFSIMAVSMGDDRIRKWHEAAVMKVFGRIEEMTSRRVKHRGEEDTLKRTGAIACARYSHDANRALDPQIHEHLIVFNMTPDSDDGKNYSVESNEWFRSHRFYTAIYRDELARLALAGGYDLEFDDDGAPQIKGMSDLVKEFSSRSNQIEYLIRECEDSLGIILSTRMRKEITYASRGFNKTRFDRIWAKCNYGKDWVSGRRAVEFIKIVRECSDGGLREATTPDVIKAQRLRIGDERILDLEASMSDAKVKVSDGLSGVSDGREKRDVGDAIDLAVRSVFSRTVLETRENLAATAIANQCGAGLSTQIESLVDNGTEGLVKVGSVLTTAEAASKELGIVEALMKGSDKYVPINMSFNPDGRLAGEQLDAVKGFASSKDFIVSMVGDAGTGKTFTTAEMVRAAVEAGRKVFMCAPSNGGRDVLRRDGAELEMKGLSDVADPFCNAQSLQYFLFREERRDALPEGSLIVLDESGLASVNQLHELVCEAKSRGWRLLLVGDPKQHTSVEAGDAFRGAIASGYGKMWRLSNIRRQKDYALGGSYKKAAALFAAGDAEGAFMLLDREGVVHEYKGRERIDKIADRYLEHLKSGRSVIVVNPTHRENETVSDAIRTMLKTEGLIDAGKSKSFTVYDSSGLPESELEKPELLKPGVLLMKMKGDGAGREVLTIEKEIGGGAFLASSSTGGSKRIWKADGYSICERREIEVCVGDKLMVRANVKPREKGGKGFINGEIVKVSGFDSAGDIVVDDGRVLDACAFTHGYASTSHKSQGSTCDAVIMGIDARSASGFADMKLAYVGATRGREFIDVYCEDKSSLGDIAERTGDRELFLEAYKKLKTETEKVSVDGRVSEALKAREDMSRIGLSSMAVKLSMSLKKVGMREFFMNFGAAAARPARIVKNIQQAVIKSAVEMSSRVLRH